MLTNGFQLARYPSDEKSECCNAQEFSVVMVSSSTTPCAVREVEMKKSGRELRVVLEIYTPLQDTEVYGVCSKCGKRYLKEV